MLLRCMRRRRMTSPAPSSPTTLQLFLPRSMPRTAIPMATLPGSELPPTKLSRRGGPSIRGDLSLETDWRLRSEPFTVPKESGATWSRTNFSTSGAVQIQDHCRTALKHSELYVANVLVQDLDVAPIGERCKHLSQAPCRSAKEQLAAASERTIIQNVVLHSTAVNIAFDDKSRTQLWQFGFASGQGWRPGRAHAFFLPAAISSSFDCQ